MLRIGPYSFREVTYDAASDVLYATLIDAPTERRLTTPEKHVVTFDVRDRLTGIAFMSAGEQLDREGAVSVTLPTLGKERVQGAETAVRHGRR